jgi:hypothetical protein
MSHAHCPIGRVSVRCCSRQLAFGRLLVMTYGKEEERLLFGFRLMDQDCDGRISKADLSITAKVHSSLGLHACLPACLPARPPLC